MRNVWKRDRDARPGAKDEQIAATEALIDRKLPAAYVELLRQHNGGRLLFNAFPTSVPTSWSKHSVPVDTLYGVGPDQLDDARYLVEEWDMDPSLVPICGNGHTWICLEYSVGGEPLVVWIDNEREPSRVVLAESFAGFVDQLVRADRRHVFGLKATGMSREEVAVELANVLETTLAPSFADALCGDHPRWKSFDRYGKAWFVLDAGDGGDFPEAADCRWILACDVASAHAAELEQGLVGLSKLESRLLHRPLWDE